MLLPHFLLECRFDTEGDGKRLREERSKLWNTPLPSKNYTILDYINVVFHILTRIMKSIIHERGGSMTLIHFKNIG